MVYSTDRSKAVVPVLVLLFVALWFVLRGDLFYVLPCVILFLCFLVLLKFAITSLGEERANRSAFRAFVRFVFVWICLVSSSSWCLGRAAVCDMWLSAVCDMWLSLEFSLTFCSTVYPPGSLQGERIERNSPTVEGSLSQSTTDTEERGRGDSQWSAFIANFERHASRGEWSDKGKLDRLYHCLPGTALEFVNALVKTSSNKTPKIGIGSTI